MNRSLQWRLSRALALAIVLIGLAAGAASFVFAYEEAQEFQDDTLRQIAALADADHLRGSGHDRTDIDPDARVMILRLPSAGAVNTTWLPSGMQPGLHTLDGPGGRWRVFVRETQSGTRIAAAQATEGRDEIAIDSALRTMVPLTLLLPLLIWLTVRIVRTQFAPVRRLAQTLDTQPAERPAALPDAGLPEEIAPFVRAINRLLERVNRLMGEQRRFIADAAHELRSPLTALSLQAQNLEKADTIEALRVRVAPLRAGIERARRLTEQLLNLARGQADAPGRETAEVSKVARDLIAEHLPLAEARAIDLGLEDTGNLLLSAEPHALRLVLKNALDNALRYTPSGGEVTLRLYSEGEEAVIDVIDTGPGIPAGERERAFAPFHRLDGAGGEGSGLGLAIARDAAARLGGTVSLHDRHEGSGLVFRYRQRCAP